MRYLYSGDTIKTLTNTGRTPKDSTGTVIGLAGGGVLAYFPKTKTKEILYSGEFIQAKG